ncbi:MAG: hypothetical protein M3400_09305 [Actinomycetota bacterium]|nr:hypothetical protein [Actinomycetota bacterium]
MIGVLAFLPSAAAEEAAATRPFKAADLKVQVNATDGDAGLQIFLDDDAWNHITILNPAGQVLVDLSATGPLKDDGLTELFSESSEPPFDEFPLADFKRLFLEGDYVLLGQLTDGTLLRSDVPLTHDFPSGPIIVAARVATVPAGQPRSLAARCTRSRSSPSRPAGTRHSVSGIQRRVSRPPCYPTAQVVSSGNSWAADSSGGCNTGWFERVGQ